MRDVSIKFMDVTFGFAGGNPIFSHLSIELQGNTANGKVVSLMGPSGVGKSTFCHLALGTRRPNSGSIHFRPAEATIAAIPQKGVMFDELSVPENIACLKYSTTLGHTFRQERVSEAVRTLGLEAVVAANTPPSAISGGEAQRVMLARIQTVGCDLLVLDEPCSFLDNRVKESFLNDLRATVDAGRILALMVTHVWDEIQMVADEVIFFHRAGNGTVSLHQTTVAAAVERPPTVDALYAIYWPDCELIGRGRLHALIEGHAAEIPDEVAYIGLFTNATKSARCSLAEVIGQRRASTSKRAPAQRAGRPPLKHSVFFRADGVIIPGHCRDEPVGTDSQTSKIE